MRTGTLVSAARHKVPVPKCSIMNRYSNCSWGEMTLLTVLERSGCSAPATGTTEPKGFFLFLLIDFVPVECFP